MRKTFDLQSIQVPEPPYEPAEVVDGIFPADKNHEDVIVRGGVIGDMADLRLTQVRMEKCHAADWHWRGCVGRDLSLEKCQWNNADWQHATLVRGQVLDSKAVGWHISNGSFSNCLFRNSKLSLLRAIQSQWENCWFENCDLREAEFEGSRFHNVVLRNCDLRNARFAGCGLKTLDLRGSAVNGICIDPKGIHGLTISPEQADAIIEVFGVHVRKL